MYLKPVHLLMLADETDHNDIRVKKLLSRSTETGVCRQRFVLAQPRADRAIWNIHVEATAKQRSGVCHGVPQIKRGYGFEHEFERVRFVLAGFCGEAVEAFRALKELQSSQTIAPFASSCDGFAVTLRARRVWLLGWI